MVSDCLIFVVSRGHTDKGRILQASRVPEHAVMANRTMIKQGLIEPVQVQRALNHRVSFQADLISMGTQLMRCRALRNKAHRLSKLFSHKFKLGGSRLEHCLGQSSDPSSALVFCLHTTARWYILGVIRVPRPVSAVSLQSS